MLDPTEQRILGVLIEKELAVPESYPMTEKALLAGCNQKSNRDPEMALELFQLEGALRALQIQDWVVRAERAGGRAARYRHRADPRLAVDASEKAVLAELLLRGPQAPGALKPRLARLGWSASADEVESLLERLAARPSPLVERLPRQPRERDARWAHCLGPRGEGLEPEAEGASAPGKPSARPSLEQRLERLETTVAELQEQIEGWRTADARES